MKNKTILIVFILLTVLLLIALAILVSVAFNPSSPYLTWEFIILWLIYAVISFVFFMVDKDV